jgi:hypothetical protein
MLEKSKVVSGEEQEKLLEEIHEELMDIYRERTKRYGNTIIHELGLKGRFSDIHNKHFRLYSELWNEEVEDWELDDIYEHARDLANYTTFLMNQIKLIKEGKIEKY